MHKDHITHNIIRKSTNNKGNQHLFSDLHLIIFIQPRQSIRFRMLHNIQIQFSNKSRTSDIGITTSINYHTTYLILNITPSVKDVIPLLIYIILFNLCIQNICYNQGLPLNWIYNLHIATILQEWHLINIRFVTFKLDLAMLYDHFSFI